MPPSSVRAPPTAGDLVRAEDLDHWNGSAPAYVATGQSRYDANGRQIEATDARGNRTTTEYTTANGGLVTQMTVTNPLGQKVTTFGWNRPGRAGEGHGRKQLATSSTTTASADHRGVAARPDPGPDPQHAVQHVWYAVLTNQPTAATTETLLPTGSAYKKSVTSSTAGCSNADRRRRPAVAGF